MGGNNEDIPAFALDLNQDYRYNVRVSSRLVLFLPVTSFRPEPMRVSERECDGGKWFEVEIYTRHGKWVDQKSSESEIAAVNDARGWYPDPCAQPADETSVPAVGGFGM